jgi:uncharacterized protein YecE (DUF72 family)
MNLYVGTSGYSYGAWKGKFYPKEAMDRRCEASDGHALRRD